MKKMSTLYKKNPEDLGRVLEDQLDEENLWVFDDGVIATRKFDGTACAVIDGELYKRYDAKKNRKAPDGAIPCCEKDGITGHHPHWVKCDRNNPSDKYHFEAFDNGVNYEDGTYELIGKKIQKNKENVVGGHKLVKHGCIAYKEKELRYMLENVDNLKHFLSTHNIEGIVFHHPDGRMCKIRKKDFGFKR